ncbi:DUF6879 family protein [Actinomadura keratinilytica]|uniref:DUF6879 family protein n=1 Tax=Actinomadura keratinilytica TaxID=547461 RepID=UPI0031EAD9DE
MTGRCRGRDGRSWNQPDPKEAAVPDFRALDFVGQDPDSDKEYCPAVFVDPNTGDLLIQGRVITDPGVLVMVREHGAIADDEAVVWLPASMKQMILDAVGRDYDERHGHGQPTFADLLARATRSAVHLEMRDFYGPSPGFEDWKAGGSGRIDDGGRWERLIGDAVARGVRVRRVRIVSEPVSDYIRWEYMVSDENIRAGEEIRWLPRRQASGIMLPHSDFWMYDQRLVVFNFNDGHGNHVPEFEYTSDPRRVSQIVATFEQAWERAIPHERYKVD